MSRTADILLAAAQRHPQKLALVDGARRATFAEVDAQSSALAHALVRRGTSAGERVVCLLDHSLEAVIAFWGIAKAGAVAVFVHPHIKSDRLAFVLGDAAPTCLVIGAELTSASEGLRRFRTLRSVLVTGNLPLGWAWDVGTAEVVVWGKALSFERSHVPPPVGADDELAALVYTSLGVPGSKAVMLSHRGIVAAADSLTTMQELTEDDVVMASLPLSFDFAIDQLVAATGAGARVVIAKTLAWPAELLAAAIGEGVTVFPGVPSLFASLAETAREWGLAVPSVRHVMSAGDATPANSLAAIQAVFPHGELHSAYGLTECRCCAHMTPALFASRHLSVGRACPGVTLWLEDAAGKRLPSGAVGELVVEGDASMIGYWHCPVATTYALRPSAGTVALHTGDQCRIDADGCVYLVGRHDEIIRASGRDIALKEIERVLHTVPGIKEAAVIGIRHHTLGLVPKAFVALERGAANAIADLARICRHFEVWRALPKNHRGKVDRALLSSVSTDTNE